MSRKIMMILGLLMIASMVLAACGTPTPAATDEPVVPPTDVPTAEPTATPVPVRDGAWVDSVIFTSIDQADQAVAQLQSGDIDIYAYSVADPEVFKTVAADANLSYSNSLGSYNEMTFNPSGPEFKDGRLNPFSNAKIRSAMNMLIDRDNVIQNIYGGLAKAKFLPLNSAFADYVRYVDVARKLEAQYAYNVDKAKAIVDAEMTAMGATLVDGKWNYKDAPVTVIAIIRTEDQRKQIGDYFSNQLENIGFTVDRQYKTRTEASPIWNRSDPTEGQWHFYTGGWITTAISRDDGTNFAYFYTPLGSGSPLWQAYVNDPAYHNADNTGVADKLWNNVFASMDERGQLFQQAMELSMADANRVWVVDQLSFSPFSSKLAVPFDLAGGISGTQLFAYALRFKDVEGGTVRVAQPGILVEPWNPVSGSNWIYDTMPRRMTEDYGVIGDPYTGLAWPQRIEKMDVTVETGLPVAKSLDWVTLTTADSIAVPADAWGDWDATTQTFIPAGEGKTAKAKIVVTYPADLFETVKWHDGSPLSVGDFVMNIIMTFDRAKAESAIYDEAYVPSFDSFMSVFKGVKIVSTNPLVIETYTDAYQLDAELFGNTWWPQYGFGQAPWQTIGLGNQAEAAKELTWSTDKSTAISTENAKVEWMSFIAGPSLDILKKYLDSSTTAAYIPFAPTMGAYVTADEAATRYANTAAWYAQQGHFWIGTGPFYLDKAYTTEMTLTLLRNPNFPDKADKWARFGAPMIAELAVDGPGQVQIGTEAKFDVFATFQGEAYPADQIDAVKWLLYDATGTLVATGAGAADSVVLPADVTSKLAAGANKLEVAFTSKAVSIPSFATFEFVTAP